MVADVRVLVCGGSARGTSLFEVDQAEEAKAMLQAQQAMFERLHPHNLPVTQPQQPQQQQQQQPPVHVEPPARGLPGRGLCACTI